VLLEAADEDVPGFSAHAWVIGRRTWPPLPRSSDAPLSVLRLRDGRP
jgi:hypothetical protein